MRRKGWKEGKERRRRGRRRRKEEWKEGKEKEEQEEQRNIGKPANRKLITLYVVKYYESLHV